MFLSCGEINKNILYIIIPSIIMILENIFFYEYEPYNHYIIFNINQAIAKCIAIIPLIISYFINKKINDKNAYIKDNLYNKKYADKYNKHEKIRKYGLLSLCIGLTLIFKLLHYSLLMVIYYRLSFWMIDLFFIYILSLFILNTKLYKHQYYSIISILFLAILLNITNNVERADKLEILYIFIMIGIHLIYSLSIIMKKYVMEYTFISVYELIVYEGLASLILFLILLPIATNNPLNKSLKNCIFYVYDSKCFFDNFYSYYEKVNTKEVFIFLFIVIYYVIYYICFNNTIKQYTACHIYLISFFEEPVFYKIIKRTITGWKLISDIIILILFLFLLLVFTEIIEVNIYNLQYNTKRNIKERAQKMRESETGESNTIEFENYKFKLEKNLDEEPQLN